MKTIFELIFLLAGFVIIIPVIFFFFVCFQTLFEQGHYFIGGAGMLLIISVAGLAVCTLIGLDKR